MEILNLSASSVLMDITGKTQNLENTMETAFLVEKLWIIVSSVSIHLTVLNVKADSSLLTKKMDVRERLKDVNTQQVLMITIESSSLVLNVRKNISSYPIMKALKITNVNFVQ